MRVLFVAHGFPPAAQGGTEIYVHDLARALARSGDEVHVLAREADPGRPERAVRTETSGGIPVTLVNNTFRECASFEETYRNARIREIAARVLDDVKPGVCHVHHLTCLTTDLVDELAARRVPVVFTLNDYWLLCQRGQLLDLDYARCGGPFPEGCARCLWTTPREARKRHAHVLDLASRVDLFLTPSRTLHNFFLAQGFPAERLERQEQGIDVAPFAGIARASSPRLRVGFAGSLIVSKAPHLLLEAVALLAPGDFELHVWGAYAPYHGDDAYRAVIEPLLARPGVVSHGSIPHAGVAAAFAALDVLVVPSVWVENAPFVIKEAYAAGLPVVASDLGGMAELVRHEETGLLFRPGDASDLARTLRRLRDEGGLMDRLRAGLPKVKTIELDAAETRERYGRLAARIPPARMTVRKTLLDRIRHWRTATETR